MVKIRVLNSGLLKMLDDDVLCCDTGYHLIRIGEAHVGDHVLMNSSVKGKDEVAEILEKVGIADA